LAYAGWTFDQCKAPSIAQMNAWLASPYRGVGVYIGGNSAACPPGPSNPNLSAGWVNAVGRSGWTFLPLYVGSQAPTGCPGSSTTNRISADLPTAAAQGVTEADDAASKAASFGFRPAFGVRPGSPVYFDLEAYTRGSGCTTPVNAFIGAWVQRMHQLGYTAGFYSSGASGIADQVARCQAPMPSSCPDDMWFAHWNGNGYPYGDQYMPDPPDNRWLHARHHQYLGGHNETWGGVLINIDSTGSDGLTARRAMVPFPTRTG
jgi:hypothetical protein